MRANQEAGGDPYATRVPDGLYRVTFRECQKGHPYGRPVWFVHFVITEEGQHTGLPVLRFYNVPAPQRPFLPRTHNLALDFMAVTGRRPPKGLKPGDFLKGCEVLAEVVTVKHQMQRRRIELPEGTWYSKIDRILRITAGMPPFGIRPPSGDA